MAENKDKKIKKPKKGQNIDEHGCIIIPPPKTVGNKDHFQRLNYLYQLGMFNTLENESSISMILSKKYMHNLDIISKKTKSNMLPNTKRTICKRCKRILIPSKTCTYKMENKQNKHKEMNPKDETFVITCKCGEIKRFRIGLDRNYKNFYEKEGTLSEVTGKKDIFKSK
ncbi:similar to Saccharomyces cerevisiae YIR015W RPR2 Subunit of nuclear RNase P [Maudiozyma barnettii]|uniref:Similar to Saccharomyces cerevisiae YIR015W RPR2 Subunit of nuclear RNase P n=1 Tax=Maudiozyma barnettii TaxID=61262 RepID=A0A8H2ZGA4_9SACH|nr:ribonuclease P protein subunit RPR2 [Kazachstania barnettii]CAB4253195.1 similar to Saccharomyces cerevisiae YIR015W RPR2 Subunit of nuclear RNase P [Kazachstania barnettii]CAD1780269.1 similar to Saccharomyces cerevisiae YIR015W RPR2 Subunit of nuclear RNase P [Kazachstania barnettii]